VKLLFITSSRIGDAVLSTGLLAALIERHPGLDVTVACGPAPAPLFREVPNVGRVIVLEKAKLAGHWRALWRQTVGTRWDIVIDLRQSIVSRLVRARRRYIWRKHPVRVHKVTELAAVANILPLPSPRLWHSEANLAQAAALVPDDRPVLALAPGANSYGKKWPAERYAEAAREITSEYGFLPGARILVVGDAKDVETAAPIRTMFDDNDLIDLTGATPIDLAAACLARAGFYIGNDSGLTHIAAACGIRTLGLFGPGVAWRYRPWGDHAAYLSKADDPTRDYDLCRDGDDEAALDLMKRLRVEDVVAAAERLWQKKLA
jgi:lipopolysaccharide export system permease protein